MFLMNEVPLYASCIRKLLFGTLQMQYTGTLASNAQEVLNPEP